MKRLFVGLAYLVLTHLILSIGLGSRAEADVLVVDSSGGGDFTTLTQAVAAASSNDTVLVRPGYSNSFEFVLIFRKAISIIADEGTPRPMIVGTLAIAENPAGSTVLIRGMDFSSSSVSIQVSDQANVWIEDCYARGSDGVFGINSTSGFHAIQVSNSTVSFARCVIRGGDGIEANPPYSGAGQGGPGIVAVQSTISVYGCTIQGGHAGDFPVSRGQGTGGSGGHGIDATFNTRILTEGGTIRGGNGGDGTDHRFDLGYRGGDGIELDGSGVLELRLRGEDVLGGSGGFDDGGDQGEPGLTLDAPAGTVAHYPGSARSYRIGGPTREGSNVQVVYEGVVGDRIWVMASLRATNLSLGHQGNWLTGIPGFGPFFLGEVLNQDGQLIIDFPIGNLGLGPNQGIVLYEQLLVLGASAPVITSSPSAHIIIDDAL